MFLGPYVPDESNRQGSRIDIFEGLPTCWQLTSRKLDFAGVEPLRENERMPSLNNMDVYRFFFFITLLKELENNNIKRQTLDRLVKNANGHKVDSQKQYNSDI